MKNDLIFEKITLTISIFLYALVVPYLEINNTHVFNPDWTPHVRIHEVWQLITNTSIGILSLWLIYKKRQVLLPFILSMIITGSFLISFMIKNTYDGSMKYLDGSEKTLFGLNIGIVGFGFAFVLLVLSLITYYRKNITTKNT
ncbi:hypothetical protein [Aquimarina sp. AU474]|uniref:hypothetical protein n=1 Tax=Aquimarina sp. AU474 TaxID=2108529 RepID=UPI00190F7FE6|nr:hypothetical protein [Aquimarina sp. AU474]